MSLASRRLEEYSSPVKGYYGTKTELMKSISLAMGADWERVSEVDIRCGVIKVVRCYPSGKFKQK